MEYELDDDWERLDLDAVWHFLSTDAYWNRWRTREDVDHQFRGAWRVIAAYVEGGDELVGFARAVSDGVSDAYLADVYVAPPHRGRGIGGRMVEAMVEEGLGAHFRWFLSTRDAHELYARYGFRPPDERVMERPGRFTTGSGVAEPSGA
ncbi:MAG: GNAT family N-acetyltransferase [Acidobacteria bacterium]|nr:GNAT family N-acetyltransferase [Acidobacteriota bacterium]